MSRYTSPEAAGYLLESEACAAVLKELYRLLEKFQKKVARENAVRQKDLETALGYSSELELQNAYGWDFITERQYNTYLELFRQGEAALEHHTPTKAELALHILQRICRDIRMDQEEWRLSAMTPEQQTEELLRLEQSKKDWRLKMKELKNSMLGVENAGNAAEDGIAPSSLILK